MRSAGHVLRLVVLGEAGPAPAWVLAGVAMVIAFIVVAGPRALVSADNRATRQAVAEAPALDNGALISADLTAAGRGGLSAVTIGALARAFAARLPLADLFPPEEHWGGAVMPSQDVVRPPSPDGKQQFVELAYRSELAANATVVAGALPAGRALVRTGAGGRPGSVTFKIAATRATAGTLGWRVGTVIDLGRARPGVPAVFLRVTGIIRPADPASSFWLYDPLLAAPLLEGPPTDPHWLGGVFAGPRELAGLDGAYAGLGERAYWFFPMTRDLTAADVPRLESGLAALASSVAIRHAETGVNAGFLRDTAATTGLADGLATFEAQWQSTAGAGSVLVVGLFVAGIVLLLICCRLAAQAYRPELVLLRVRGGSLGELARRMLVRSCCIVVPALTAGAALAIVVLPGSSTSAGGAVLAGLTALAAIASLPLICVLEHRRLRFAGPARHSESVTGRAPARRLVAEAAVLVVAAAAIADLRLRGAGPPGTAGHPAATGPYLSASAVLVAAAIGLLVNRLYRGPLRAAARAAAARRGAVGAVGLARAAVARADSVLPALAVMLGLTLTVFSVMVLASISSSQQAGAWAQVGADASISAQATSPVTAAELSAIRRAPGVRHVTAVYTARSDGPLGASLVVGGSGRPVGIAVVEPRSYAALAADTPWPGFPAAELASAGTRPGAAVPILVTPGIAAGVAQARKAARNGSGALRLDDSSQSVPVRMAGTITQTPAMPAGGLYVVLPRWAAPRLSLQPAPSTVLVTGPAISAGALRAVARRVLPGSKVTIRRQVLSALTTGPALRLSQELYLAGAAAAAGLTALAVLFSLATSARSRSAMLTRLAALGMARSQALLLGITEAVPMLLAAAAGTVISVWLLAEFIGPVLGLNAFTGSPGPVAVRPTWLQLVAPLAGAAMLAVTFLAIDGARSGRAVAGGRPASGGGWLTCPGSTNSSRRKNGLAGRIARPTRPALP